MAGMRVYVCDDSPEHRALLKAVLEDVDGIDVVGEACDGATCLEGLRDAHADVLVLDLRMPGVDGWEALERLRDVADRPRILVMSSAAPEEVAERVHAAGAQYLRKGAPPDVVRAAIERAAA